MVEMCHVAGVAPIRVPLSVKVNASQSIDLEKRIKVFEMGASLGLVLICRCVAPKIDLIPFSITSKSFWALELPGASSSESHSAIEPRTLITWRGGWSLRYEVLEEDLPLPSHIDRSAGL